MQRRTIYLIVGLVFAALAGGALLWRSTLGSQASSGVTRSAVVERGSMVVSVTASGRIEPAARIGLSFEAPGILAELFVEEGERVVAGDPLAQLDTAQVELQVQQAEAALFSAQAQLDQLQAGPRSGQVDQARANLQTASAQLSTAMANRDQIASGPTDADIAAARAQVAQARAAEKVAQDSYDVIDEEGTRKEQANYDLYTAKQELAAAEAQLETLTAGPGEEELRAAQANVAAAVAQRDASQAQLDQLLGGATPQDIIEGKAQVEQAQAGLALAEHSLGIATLHAPFDGVVWKINVTPGEMSPPQQPAIILLDDSVFRMTVGVDELDISRVVEGQSAQVTVESLPGSSIRGTVRTIAPLAAVEGGIVTYAVLIDLEATHTPLRADMTANATLVAEELTDALRIPTWAVRVDRDTGQTYVHRRVKDEIERVDVELGVRFEGLTQVLQGLSEGDELVRLEEEASFGFGLR